MSAYAVHITNEEGKSISGDIYLYKNNVLIGVLHISPAGEVLSDEDLGGATAFQVDAPGYVGYAVLELSDKNTFVLVREVAKISWLLLAIIVITGYGIFKRL